MQTVRDFLNLFPRAGSRNWQLPIERAVCVPLDFLYGGAGLAAAIAALEDETGRPLIWATAQYLSFGRPGNMLELIPKVPVSGRYTTQARVTGCVNGEEILTVNAALGNRPDPESEFWVSMPKIPDRTACEPLAGTSKAIEGSIAERLEFLVPTTHRNPDEAAKTNLGKAAAWARIKEPIDMSAGVLALIADWMGIGLSRALGRPVIMNSLDNTLRVVSVREAEWVICDFRTHAIARGFAHGLVHIWHPDGHLLATASQSMVVRDIGSAERLRTAS